MGRTRYHVQNPINFYLQVKIQCRVEIIYLHDTSPHGHTPMCQIKKANVKQNKIMGHTQICRDRKTDRQTGRQTGRWNDRVIPKYPLNFVHGGMKYLKKYMHGQLLKVEFKFRRLPCMQCF